MLPIINYIERKDILQSTDIALVNPVNTIGIMGSGLALQFKEIFPGNFIAYKRQCDKKLLKTGISFIYHTHNLDNPKFIINFPTKHHWKDSSKLEYIDNGITNLIPRLEKLKITTISIPKLGCGLGGLQWETVHSLLLCHINTTTNITWNLYL